MLPPSPPRNSKAEAQQGSEQLGGETGPMGGITLFEDFYMEMT